MFTPDQNALLDEIERRLFELFDSEKTGHDFYHVMRVVEITKEIHTQEDLFKACLIAYLHDVFDDKLLFPYATLQALLDAWSLVIPYDIKTLESEILSIGYKGGFNQVSKSSEAQLVSDADVLDAMGAIGIARTFYYSGSKGWPLYDPTLNNVKVDSFESYRTLRRNAIDHFDEKLLKLVDFVETPKGKAMALKRHAVLETFVETFRDEMRVLDKFQTQ